MKLIKKLVRWFLRVLFLPFWHLERLIPRDESQWVFGSRDGVDYGDNARVFFEYILLNHPEITAIWITRNRAVYDLLRSKKINVCMMFSFKGYIFSLRSKYFVSDHGNSDMNIYMGNGAKKICLWHGMAMKKGGFFYDEYYKDQRKRIFMLKLQIRHFLCPYSRPTDLDFISVSSDFFKPFLASSFANSFGKEVPLDRFVTTGLPRNDKLFSAREQPLLAGLREKYKSCRILFYMPTFRLGLYNKIPFSAFDGYGFDQSDFSRFLEEENVVFLFKPHPYDSNLPDFSLTERFLYLKGGEYDDLYEFLGKVDILATDYSSVYFDFLLTNKPVVLMPFDYDEYIKIRGLFYDYNTYIHGVRAYNWDDFMRVVRAKEYYAIDDNSLFNFHKDAGSCERVYNAIIDRFGK